MITVITSRVEVIDCGESSAELLVGWEGAGFELGRGFWAETHPAHAGAGLCVFADLEAVDARGVDACVWRLAGIVYLRHGGGREVLVALEEEVRERSAKEGTVDAVEARRGRRIVVHAVGTEQLYPAPV